MRCPPTPEMLGASFLQRTAPPLEQASEKGLFWAPGACPPPACTPRGAPKLCPHILFPCCSWLQCASHSARAFPASDLSSDTTARAHPSLLFVA